jgi:hypothetical protein
VYNLRVKGSRVKADKRKILHIQSTLHTHAEGTGFGTCEQEGSPNQMSQLNMDSNSSESQCDVAAIEDDEYCEEVSLEPHL